MSTRIYVGMSLDGFIAAKDGSLDWLSDYPNPDGSDFGFAEFMATIDVVVMGRNTFETVLTFDQWPYSKPVWVMSRTLKAVPPHLDGNAMIVDGDPAALLHQALNAGYREIYIDGGSVIRSFLQLDMVDEMIVTTVPIVLGEGIPLFTESGRRLRFSLKKSETFIGQFVKNHYIRVR